MYTSIVLISRFNRIFRKQFPFSWKAVEAAAQFSDFWHSINKNKEKNKLELALTNSLVGIDRMDDCLAMYHKKFNAYCISLVSSQEVDFRGESIWIDKDAYKA